jgi:hypothetical protein
VVEPVYRTGAVGSASAVAATRACSQTGATNP